MLDSLLAELRAGGHLHGETPPVAPADAAASRWIIGVHMLGGWLAALCVLLFLGLGVAPLIKGATSWAVLGVCMTAAAGALVARCQGVVGRQFLLVASMAGHGALLLGVEVFGQVKSVGFFVLAAYEVLLLLWVAWMPHRLLAALIACALLAFGCAELFSPEAARYLFVAYWLATCVLWMSARRWLLSRHAEAVSALAWALTALCCAYALSPVLFGEFRIPMGARRIDLIGLCAANIALVLWLARSWLATPRVLAAIVLLLAAIGATWQAPAIAMGGLLMVLAFAQGRRTLLWLAGGLLVFGVSRYYYDLQLNLLYKSGLMVLGGGLLLAVRALLQPFLASERRP